MISFNRSMIPVICLSLFSTCAQPSHAQTDHPRINGSYGEQVGHKALNAVGNLGGAVLELPKNIINTTNQSNIVYGAVGGLFKGLVNMAGRIGVGVADLVTIPLPTKPIAYPVYIWDDFDADTSYGDVYRLSKIKETPTRVVRAPVSQSEPIAEPAIVVAPPAPTDHSGLYDDTTRKIDQLFQEQMHK